jgi:hypothetical protein
MSTFCVTKIFIQMTKTLMFTKYICIEMEMKKMVETMEIHLKLKCWISNSSWNS